MQYELMEILCLKISKLGVVAASAGRLFQLAIIQGRKLNWMNCSVTSLGGGVPCDSSILQLGYDKGEISPYF